jgi:hypothetical protein
MHAYALEAYQSADAESNVERANLKSLLSKEYGYKEKTDCPGLVHKSEWLRK